MLVACLAQSAAPAAPAVGRLARIDSIQHPWQVRKILAEAAAVLAELAGPQRLALRVALAS